MQKKKPCEIRASVNGSFCAGLCGFLCLPKLVQTENKLRHKIMIIMFSFHSLFVLSIFNYIILS